MDIDLQPGRYVVAVSGGVDSVTLLHLLAQKGQSAQDKVNASLNLSPLPYSLTVAHFDHGIRKDSVEDRKLVQQLAKKYELPFVYHSVKLGPTVSEATAREARYKFLNGVRLASKADAIITAHHQDDVLETAIINLIRGTGRRGLNSLRSTDNIKRPLLSISKKELLRYASRAGLQWREDSTNKDENYLRNYVRKNLLPRFAEPDREALLGMVRRMAELNVAVEIEVVNYLHVQPSAEHLDRQMFILLPHSIAREVMAEWLLQHTDAQLSRQLLERLVVAAKTGRAGSKVDVNICYWLVLYKYHLALRVRER